MNNSFPYSFNEKRYHTYNYYLKNKYKTKIAKIILDAGFSCPNRDGLKGIGGCIYCSDKGAGDSNLYSKEGLINQFQDNKKIMDNKWENGGYIAYFQSFTNTYGPLSRIKEMLEPFIQMDVIKEIAIATRCDCLEKEKIDYLNSLTKIKPITIELGLQTTNPKTALYINRGHTFEEFKEKLIELENTDLRVCVHIINGLPQETKEDMIQTIKDINHLPFDAIKIHMLHITKNTKLENIYKENPFPILSRDEYIKIVVEQLELLKPEIVIERLTGDPIMSELVEPFWVTNKTTILNDIDKLMRKLNTYQGAKYE